MDQELFRDRLFNLSLQRFCFHVNKKRKYIIVRQALLSKRRKDAFAVSGNLNAKQAKEAPLDNNGDGH